MNKNSFWQGLHFKKINRLKYSWLYAELDLVVYLFEIPQKIIVIQSQFLPMQPTKTATY